MKSIAQAMIISAGTISLFKIDPYFSRPTTLAAKMAASAVGGMKSPTAAISESAAAAVIWSWPSNANIKGTPSTLEEPNALMAPNSGIEIAIIKYRSAGGTDNAFTTINPRTPVAVIT